MLGNVTSFIISSIVLLFIIENLLANFCLESNTPGIAVDISTESSEDVYPKLEAVPSHGMFHFW